MTRVVYYIGLTSRNRIPHYTCSCPVNSLRNWIVVHLQSLLVPPTIPGTKFSTRLYVQCVVNSLYNCTCSARTIPCGIPVTEIEGDNINRGVDRCYERLLVKPRTMREEVRSVTVIPLSP